MPQLLIIIGPSQTYHFSKSLKKLFSNNSALSWPQTIALICSSLDFDHHSTETVFIKVLNDIRLNTDCGKVSVLLLLNLSAAFDTVDHNILTRQTGKLGWTSGIVLNWFKTYLQDRDFVSVSNFKSERTKMACGVPQGSIFGPLLFNLTGSHFEKQQSLLSQLCR
ncbi:hypothetical protein LDENG_00098110 [Lucifuga dentata]|nr:hypothetical protein LDENG_00098110 [Lucifuga dentata]